MPERSWRSTGDGSAAVHLPPAGDAGVAADAPAPPDASRSRAAAAPLSPQGPPPTEAAAEPPTEAAAEPPTEAAAEPPTEAAAEAAVEPPTEAAAEAAPVTPETLADEVSALRAEVVALRARNEELERTPRRRPVFSLAPGSTGRRAVSTVLIVLAIVLTPISVLSVWAANTLTDTNQYVTTMAPLASNPSVQAAVTTRLTNEITQSVDVPALVKRVLPAGQAELAGPLSSAVERFIGQVVSRVVHSPQFAQVWTEANRLAHTQLVGALEGTSTGGLSVESGQVRLNLGKLVSTVKRELSGAGLTVVDKIPTNRINGTFTLFQSTAVTRVQWGFSALQTMGDWFPFVVLAILLLGLWLARDRRRALIGAAVGVAVVMLLFGGAVALARGYYVGHLPASVSRPAVTAALDILLRFLRQAFWAMVVLALLFAVAAFVAGPSPIAKGARSLSSTGMGYLGDRAERAGALPTGIRTFVARYLRVWEVGVFVVAVLVLFFWRGRTVAVELWTAFFTVIALLLVQIVGRRTAHRVAGPGGGAAQEAAPQHPTAGGDGVSDRSAA